MATAATRLQWETESPYKEEIERVKTLEQPLNLEGLRAAQTNLYTIFSAVILGSGEIQRAEQKRLQSMDDLAKHWTSLGQMARFADFVVRHTPVELIVFDPRGEADFINQTISNQGRVQHYGQIVANIAFVVLNHDNINNFNDLVELEQRLIHWIKVQRALGDGQV